MYHKIINYFKVLIVKLHIRKLEKLRQRIYLNKDIQCNPFMYFGLLNLIDSKISEKKILIIKLNKQILK